MVRSAWARPRAWRARRRLGRRAAARTKGRHRARLWEWAHTPLSRRSGAAKGLLFVQSESTVS